MPHVISTRITGFDSLSNADQLRAAALALNREYAIASSALKLAVAPLGRDDRVMVAYETNAVAGAHESSVDWWWLPTVKRGDAIWKITAQNDHESIVYSAHGVANIETTALQKAESASVTSPPAALETLAAEHAKQPSLGASNQPREPLTIWIDADASNTPSEETLAWWSASLGVRFATLGTRPASAIATLIPQPTTHSKTPSTAVDRALRACSVAAIACALFAGGRYWSASKPSTDVSAVTSAASPGELWARATLAAPSLAEHAKTATYGGGAWVIAAPSLPTQELASVEAALRTNGIAAQIIRDPEIRIRIQR